MLYAVGSALPEYRIRAINNAADSNNLIHEDEHARRYGYQRGLVPGVSLFAYMTRSLVEFVGRDWLERGSASVRFLRPVYDGEEVRVTGTLAGVLKDGGLSIELQLGNVKGVTCCIGTAGLPTQTPSPEPSMRDFPAGHGKLGRPISLDLLKVGERLNPVTSEFTRKTHWEYCQKAIRDHHPIYHQVVHPGWLLSRANLVISINYSIASWIHVSSEVQNYRTQEAECVVETRGRVADKFERKGHHYVVLDLAAFAGERCLETIKHTVIFRIAPRAA